MKKYFLIALLGLFASCSNFKTHGTFLTEQKDAWFDGYIKVMGATSDSADRGLLYCRANLKENGVAEPVCYRPKFEK